MENFGGSANQRIGTYDLSILSSANPCGDTFKALADRLRVRDDKSLIASKVTADEYIDSF